MTTLPASRRRLELTPLGPLPPERPRIAATERRPMRTLQIARAAARCFLRLARARLVEEANGRAAGAIVRETLEGLGGLWIRLGEALSVQDTVFGKDFCLELQEIAEHAPAFPAEVARRVIEEEYGEPIASMFSSFEDEPIGAGAVAQVHRAVLAGSGRTVAVKVRRPDAPETFGRDLKLARRVLRFLARFHSFQHYQFREAILELEQIVKEDLDLRRESANLRLLGRELRSHGIRTPRTWRSLSRERVLVAEFMEGVPLSRILAFAYREPDVLRTWLEANQIDLAGVGRRLSRSFTRQTLDGRYFHGALHPSNILVGRRGKIGLVDFGLVGRTEVDAQRSLRRVLWLLSRRDYAKTAQALIALFEPIPAVDIDQLKKDLSRVMRAWEARARVETLPYDDRSYVSLTGRLAVVFDKYRIPLEWSLSRIDFSRQVLDAALRTIHPEADYLLELEDFFDKSNARRARRLATDGQVVPNATAAFAALNDVPRRMAEFGSRLETVAIRNATGVEAPTSKMASMFTMYVQMLRLSGAALAVSVALLFVHQVVFPLPSSALPGRLSSFVDGLPILFHIDWTLVGAYLFLVLRQLRRIARRLDQKEDYARSLFD